MPSASAVAFRIITERETLSVDAQGNIGRPAIGMQPSGGWKAVALVSASRGHPAGFIPFDQWTAERLGGLQWRFKNGKPRYTLRDLDHGTVRVWGSGVLQVEIAQ